MRDLTHEDSDDPRPNRPREHALKRPGTIESHWIPTDRELWGVERDADFLAARRELLAAVANDFLDSLRACSSHQTQVAEAMLGARHPLRLGA